jgi:hypothetical protein
VFSNKKKRGDRDDDLREPDSKGCAVAFGTISGSGEILARRPARYEIGA